MIQFDTKSYFAHHIIKMETTVLLYKCMYKRVKLKVRLMHALNSDKLTLWKVHFRGQINTLSTQNI